MDWWTRDPEPWSRNWETEEIEEDDTLPPEPIFRVRVAQTVSNWSLVVKESKKWAY